MTIIAEPAAGRAGSEKGAAPLGVRSGRVPFRRSGESGLLGRTKRRRTIPE